MQGRNPTTHDPDADSTEDAPSGLTLLHPDRARNAARRHFGPIHLGDKRRNRRAQVLATALFASDRGTITGLFPDRNKCDAAYDLCHHPRMTPQAVLDAHRQLLRERITAAFRAGHRVLLIEDTTALPFNTRKGCTGLGPIGKDFTRGLFQHNTLVVAMDPAAADAPGDATRDTQREVAAGTRVLGLLEQHYWARDEPPASRTPDGRRRHDGARQGKAERESTRWGRAVQDHRAWLEEIRRESGPDALPPVYVADRESDIFGVLRLCRDANVDLVVRAKQNRKLEGTDALLMEHLATQPVREIRELEVFTGRGQAVRTAQLEVRTASVSLRSPQAKGRAPGTAPPLKINVVELRETDASFGPTGLKEDKRVCWRLVTSLPVDTLAQVDQVVEIYRRRWLVEELHKALKTGLKLCESQLRDAEAIKVLASLKSVVAAELLDVRQRARVEPDVALEASDADEAEVAVLEAEYGPPPAGGWTLGELLRRIAMLGGFMGRPGDGLPGWQTIWRGRQKLDLLAAGWRLARGSPESHETRKRNP